MCFLIRMIESERWKQNEGSLSDISMISADSLSDLVTGENCISTWLVQNLSEPEIKKAIQALSSGFGKLDCIDIVVLDHKELLNAGFSIIETDGNTPIDIYKPLHRDISHLNVGSLSRLAEFILQNIRNNKLISYPKDRVGEWLLEAMIDKILDFSKLRKEMKANFASFINKRIKNGKTDESTIPDEQMEMIKKQVLQNSLKTNCKYEVGCERINSAL